jgi:hypothetical protein
VKTLAKAIPGRGFVQSKSFKRQFSSHPEPITSDFADWQEGKYVLIGTLVLVPFSETIESCPAEPRHKHHQNKGLVYEAAN